MLHHYDKYACEPFYPERDIKALYDNFYDVVFCCNVLNVNDDNNLPSVIYDLHSLNCGTFVIQIYEGNKSGNGGCTRDGYQRNEPAESYREIIHEVFGDSTIERKGNVLLVTR
ncbi:hypothetical protein AB733_22985 [Photobacterium swingsii]|uniref:Methyltransferase type 11 domain-containing protein n=1 Tax=Photobacterium swingsii TaxID=680026 RepID=A0A0J8V793_9GAMM|nr:hypothetical protein AB733_22985 [Photobacterium swingsii]PSW24514.1 hypothetical protein C9I94_10785 [Photobacterium swingsii]